MRACSTVQALYGRVRKLKGRWEADGKEIARTLICKTITMKRPLLRFVIRVGFIACGFYRNARGHQCKQYL